MLSFHLKRKKKKSLLQLHTQYLKITFYKFNNETWMFLSQHTKIPTMLFSNFFNPVSCNSLEERALKLTKSESLRFSLSMDESKVHCSSMFLNPWDAKIFQRVASCGRAEGWQKGVCPFQAGLGRDEERGCGGKLHVRQVAPGQCSCSCRQGSQEMLLRGWEKP